MLERLIEDILHVDQSSKPESSAKELKKDEAHLRFLEMSAYENELHYRGVSHVAGIDEAGRGPLAGPVVAGCVILPENFYLPDLNDSKKLTKKKREALYQKIMKEARVGIGIASVQEIDHINILEATKRAMIRAVCALDPMPNHLLIDALNLPLDIPQTNIIKGDAKSISIAAASIVAKVTRDELMERLDEMYPIYGFKTNSGYGTKAHMEAIKSHGITLEHRKSFEPIRSIISEKPTLFD